MPSFADLRCGARSLAKAPGFSAATLAALALGMGACTAIFSVVDAVLLKAVPFHEPSGLVVIWESNAAQHRTDMLVAPRNFFAWQGQCRSLEGAGAIFDLNANLTAGPNGNFDPEEIKVERISATLLPVLGVPPALGRGFRREEERPGASSVALLSHSLWSRRFGRDPAIAGRPIILGGRSYTVVGILPAGFSILEPGVDVWTPLDLEPGDARRGTRRTLAVVARLKAGARLEQARAELSALGNSLERTYPEFDSGWRPSVVPLREQIVGSVQQPLLVITAAVGFLLLIACANVANLLLARGATRRREIAIRSALGATRGRIIGELLTESLTLAFAGGLLGLVLAAGAVSLIVRLGPASIPHLANATVDARVFLFALGVSAATGILFGVTPALHASGGNLSAAIGASRGGTMSRSGRRMRNMLVASEIGLAVVVLIGAGLLGRSFVRLRAAEYGFQASGLLTMRLPLAGGRNTAVGRRIAFFQQVTARLAELPGVRGVGAVNSLPMTGFGVGSNFAVAGRPEPPRDQRPLALLRSVTPGYFRTMGIPVVAGRVFTAADTEQAPAVIMVDRTLARHYWPGGDAAAIGGRIVIDAATNGRVGEIVGVVGDVKPEKVDGEEWPTIYNPYPQAPASAMEVVVRTTAAPTSLASAVTRVVHLLDPEQPLAQVRPMDAIVDQAFAAALFDTLVLGVFAGIAFILAAVGIYGVISYDVSERTREIGIRMAMGAQRRDVLRLVLGEGARMACYGIAGGLTAALALTRTMQSMLYGVKATDALTFAAIALLLAVVALAASYVPSRRAMRLDALTALRHE